MPKMQTSFKGLVKLLAKSLYPEANVFIRELIQNAHDSIQLRKADEPQLAGKIDILTDPEAKTITFSDNGLGMDRTDIESFLSTIGRTGTGERTKALAERDVAVDTIGQFGIGLLSAFVVAERIEVFTRKRGEDKAFHWLNRGGEEYELKEITQDKPPAGHTRVLVTIHPDHVGTIKEQEVRKLVKRYADFLPFPIYLNGQGPLNAINAPWHQEGGWAGEEDYRQALSRFLNDRYKHDTPLHLIPVDLKSPRAKGALYISDNHVPGINTFGVVDIFQERMCIRLDDQELLPEWAKFVRGIVDSPVLKPTAARDNVIKEEGAYFRLRKALGELVIESLTKLSSTDKEKFHRLCNWHHYHFKGMAVHDEAFYDAIIDHLPFETNRGNLTMKDLIGRQSVEIGEKVPVYFFRFSYNSNQFYEICNAKGIIAIDTGRNFDEDLVRRYVARHADTMVLKQLNDLDDPNLYRRLSEEEHRSFFPLEGAIRRALENVGLNHVRPTTRAFEPKSMSGAILEPQIAVFEKMERLMKQPFMIEGLGELAEEFNEQLRQRQMDFFLNANNPLIQNLQALDNIGDPRYHLIMVGVYNMAILYSQQSMSQANAKIFYSQFQENMLRTLELENLTKKLAEEKAALQVRVVEQGAGTTTPDHDWVRLFVMMPYADEYDSLEMALREILEAPPYCFELVLARDMVRKSTMRANLSVHIRSSDGFIADVSDHSPNVMMELGWALFDPKLRIRPALLLCAKDKEKDFPVDIADQLRIVYAVALNDPKLIKELAGAFEKNGPLQELAKKERKRFLSSTILRGCYFLPDERRKQLVSKAYATVEEVLDTDQKTFSRRMAEVGDIELADLLVPLQGFLKRLPRV